MIRRRKWREKGNVVLWGGGVAFGGLIDRARVYARALYGQETEVVFVGDFIEGWTAGGFVSARHVEWFARYVADGRIPGGHR